jgi:hypothetical protein
MIDVQYPAIMVWKNRTIWIGRTHDELFYSAMHAYKKGMFEKAKIYDSLLNVFEITTINKYKGKGLFGGYNLYFNRRIVLYPEFRELNKINIKDLKSMLIGLSNKGIYRSGDDASRIKLSIETANTFEEIFISLDIILNGPQKMK